MIIFPSIFFFFLFSLLFYSEGRFVVVPFPIGVVGTKTGASKWKAYKSRQVGMERGKLEYINKHDVVIRWRILKWSSAVWNETGQKEARSWFYTHPHFFFFFFDFFFKVFILLLIYFLPSQNLPFFLFLFHSLS